MLFNSLPTAYEIWLIKVQLIIEKNIDILFWSLQKPKLIQVP